MSSIQSITESFKDLSVEELLAIIAAASAEAKKAVKAVAKAPKEVKEKKGSMPKGVVPPQLRKPRAWVDFTLAHANANGWESFEVKGHEALPASIELNGKHVFESTGKPMNNKQAMSLSKVRWDRKEGKGTHKDLYDEFDAGYVEEQVPAVPVAEQVAEEPVVKEKKNTKAVAPKKTMEEKKAEKEAAALAKAAEKEAAALAKAVEKEAAALAKAAEKEAAAFKKTEQKASVTGSKAKKAVLTNEAKEEVPAFECENDGQVYPWVFKGKKFYRDYNGNMWHRTNEDSLGDWAGKFDSATNTIDDSAEEPLYEDKE